MPTVEKILDDRNWHHSKEHYHCDELQFVVNAYKRRGKAWLQKYYLTIEHRHFWGKVNKYLLTYQVQQLLNGEEV